METYYCALISKRIDPEMTEDEIKQFEEDWERLWNQEIGQIEINRLQTDPLSN